MYLKQVTFDQWSRRVLKNHATIIMFCDTEGSSYELPLNPPLGESEGVRE